MHSIQSGSFEDGNELLLRQIHPTFIQEGRMTSQAFRPTPKDQKLLSVNRSSKIKPLDAYILHTEIKKLSSVGVWGVSVSEVNDIDDLNIKEDPIENPIEDKSHSLIDFSLLDSESRIKAISSKLADKARKRGCLHQPT
jgi:hypothetical protein